MGVRISGDERGDALKLPEKLACMSGPVFDPARHSLSFGPFCPPPPLQFSASCSPIPSSLHVEPRHSPVTFKSSGWSSRTPDQEEGVSVPKSWPPLWTLALFPRCHPTQIRTPAWWPWTPAPQTFSAVSDLSSDPTWEIQQSCLASKQNLYLLLEKSLLITGLVQGMFRWIQPSEIIL